MDTGKSRGSLSDWHMQFGGTFSLSRWISGLMSGLIIGLLEVILAISFAALIFAGPLSPFLVQGVGLAVAGAALSVAIVGLLTSLPGTVSGSQDVRAAILAVAVVPIAAAVPAAVAAEATFITVVAAIALTTTLTGLFFYGLGHFRLGSLVRFLPYPVVGGFLAGTGWLLGPFPAGRLWPVVSPADLSQVHWPALARQAINIITVCLMSTVALLLNASGLELTTSREMDLNRELRVAGLANLVTALSGGLVGYHQLSLSALNDKLGGNNRMPAIVAAAVCVLVLLLGGSLLSLFPKFVLGGLLFFLGLSFMVEWTVQSWSTLPRVDYAIVLAILLVTAIAGFLEAVAVGVLVSVALFVVNYSRIDVVREELTGANAQSRVTWRPAQRQLLHAHAAQLHILRLQGYIFFGTADRLQQQVRGRIEARESRPRYLILDFRHVSGIDLTALSSFLRIRQSAHAHGVTLLLAGASPTVRRQLSGAGVVDASVRIFSDLDRASEWCERQLLAALEEKENLRTEDPLQQELLRVLGRPELVDQLLAYFERQEVAAGDYLLRQDAPPDYLYLIESGQVTAHLETEGGEGARLQTMEGGHVLGEPGFFLGTARTASVIADEPSVIYRLSQEGLARMCALHPDLAAAFHRVIIHLLSERVVHLVTAVHSMQR